jgi:integrating conjugative element protein (TIGR03761 family)
MTMIEANPMEVTALSAHRRAKKSAALPSQGRSNQPRRPDIVTRDESGRAVTEPERLTNGAGDAMTLHTSDALRLFVGQAADVRWRVEALVGGKHFASALKEMWFLSARDHPYADWLLIRAYNELAAQRANTTDAMRTRQNMLDDLRKQGLSMRVMASARPVSVSLGFRSPYGYAVAAAIVEFDHYVRLVQTLILKDQLASVQGQNEIRVLSNRYYELFRKSMKWKRLLLHEDLKTMTRKDFAPDADDAASQRVRAAVGFFGGLPPSVLLREEVPRHKRQMRMAPLSAMPDSPDSTLLNVGCDAAVVVTTDEQPLIAAPEVSRETSSALMAGQLSSSTVATP